MNATNEILNYKISFVIAHRLNTIKNSDLIVFIEDKNIVEMGTHDQLIANQKYYYNLYMTKEKNKRIIEEWKESRWKSMIKLKYD